MKLTYSVVKALASPTRIAILRHILDGETTPSDLSHALDKAKSTITSHADTLEAAGLLKRDQEDGRRRVIYEPTATARAIANGETRHVEFAITTAVLAGATGVFTAVQPTSKQATTATMTTSTTQPATQHPGTAFIVISIVLLLITLVSLWYSWLLSRLQSPANS